MAQIGGLAINNSGPAPTPTAAGSPSVKHDIGQLFGHVLNALPGYSSLAANIINPNVNYQGVANPGYSPVSPISSKDVNKTPPKLPPTDPYAAYGGQSAYNSAISGFDTQHQNILGSENDAISNAGLGLNSNILDFLDSLKATQTGIDRQSVQNELAKKQGTASVLDAVGHGIKSGGVILANKNASNSSAGDALAAAYADIGRRQLSGVGNQYAQGQNAVQQSEADLATQEAGGVRQLQTSKTQVVNGIVGDAQTKLAALDGQIASANLPDRINIEAEKEQVRQTALSQLQQYDQLLSQGVAGITPATQAQNQAQAASMASAGTAPDNSFNFSTQMPAQFQSTGPFASDLPLFTTPGAKKQTA